MDYKRRFKALQQIYQLSGQLAFFSQCRNGQNWISFNQLAFVCCTLLLNHHHHCSRQHHYQQHFWSFSVQLAFSFHHIYETPESCYSAFWIGCFISTCQVAHGCACVTWFMKLLQETTSFTIQYWGLFLWIIVERK